jgi:hypothetical protein
MGATMTTRRLKKRGLRLISKEGFVALTSVLALLASGLKAYDDVSFSGLHTLALIAMLAAFVYFIGSFLSTRSLEVPDLSLAWPARPKEGVKLATAPLVQAVGHGECRPEDCHREILQAKVLPCSASEFLFVDRQRGPGEQRFGVFKGLSRWRKSKIRVVIVRNATVDRSLLEELAAFPNLGLIDIQHCAIDAETWHWFAEFDSLKILAVFGAADPGEEREFAYTLPALQMIFEPTEFIPARANVV